jgi:nucleoside-diphosphate-sugar epimerase
MMETVSILGCGWYGLALAKALVADGYEVKGSTTSADKLALLEELGIAAYLVNLASEEQEFEADFFKSEILVICISSRKKDANSLSLANQMERICRLAKSKQVIFISSTGIYQDGNFVVDENVIPKPTTEVGKSLVEAETLLRENPSFTTTIIRFGGLIGPNRNLAKHFAGKKEIANGLAPINLIHLDDCIGLTKAILEQRAFGLIYHGVAPIHPTRADFYTQACLNSGLEKPEFIDELLDWKQVESVNVPRVYAMANLLTLR